MVLQQRKVGAPSEGETIQGPAWLLAVANVGILGKGEVPVGFVLWFKSQKNQKQKTNPRQAELSCTPSCTLSCPWNPKLEPTQAM